MTTFYVSSVDGDDADDGSTWALAKATITGALAAATGLGPHLIYAEHVHSESPGAAITWNAATSGAVIAFISVNRSTGTWTTGAAVTTGANVAAFNICTTGAMVFYFYGFALSVNNGNSNVNDFNIATSASRVEVEFDECSLSIPGTGTGAQYLFGSTTTSGVQNIVTLRDTTITTKDAASMSAIIANKVRLNLINVTHVFAGASKSPTLFSFNANNMQAEIQIMDSDLSGFNSGNYIDVGNFSAGQIVFTNVKLHATPGLVTGIWANNLGSIVLINTDSGDTHNVFEFRNRLGTITESTSIYANSGAEFNAVGISWQIVTTASCNEHEPFVTPWLHGPFSGTTEITASLEVVHDSATNLDDRDAWGEFEYVSSAAFPIGTLVTNRNAQPFDGTGAAHGAGAATWTGTGGFTNENKQKITKTFTPAEKSLLRGRLVVGVASKTLYLDPWIRGA